MLLEVEGLQAGYGDVPAVWDLDLRVDAGEVVALLGPNGSGKTTTLLTVARFLKPLAGHVRVDGRDLDGTAPHAVARSGVAFIPDDRALLPSLTVRENLALVTDTKRDPLELFPALKPLLGRRAGLLSGGEQQMLALARAFANEPRLLLIDELSQGLAPVIVNRLMPAVRQAADEWGAGVLLVEQEVVKALSVADRAYVLSHGRVMIDDEPADALLADRDRMEAAYLGQGHNDDAPRLHTGAVG